MAKKKKNLVKVGITEEVGNCIRCGGEGVITKKIYIKGIGFVFYKTICPRCGGLGIVYTNALAIKEPTNSMTNQKKTITSFMNKPDKTITQHKELSSSKPHIGISLNLTIYNPKGNISGKEADDFLNKVIEAVEERDWLAGGGYQLVDLDKDNV